MVVAVVVVTAGRGVVQEPTELDGTANHSVDLVLVVAVAVVGGGGGGGRGRGRRRLL